MTTADGPVLQQIERLAGERFREVGLDSVADDEPASLDELAAYAAAGRGWVGSVEDAGESADGVVGYVLVDVIGGAAHIEQITVHPAHQGAGVGRALLDAAAAWARANGLAALTLTTFARVPWNRPLYEHLGFRVLDDAEIGAVLRSVRDHEAALGLDPTIRVCMRLDLDPG